MVKIVEISENETPNFQESESIVKVYLPNCVHCEAMKTAWKDLERDLKDNYEGDVGVFDIHAEALSNTNIPALQGINGYPTILAIKDGEAINYDGNRSKDDMLQFFSKHLDLRKKQAGGKRKTKSKSRKNKSKRRKSLKRKSLKRKSLKRKSLKRKSLKRKSLKRKSKKRRNRGGANMPLTAHNVSCSQCSNDKFFSINQAYCENQCSM